MPTVAQIFARTLKKAGVRFVFGVPSGNMIDYIEALNREPGIDFVLVAHETTAAIMADICGRLTGIPGVCFGTFGPGATNLATGVGGAMLDRSPLLAFTDEMPDKLLQRTVQMNIDHQQLFKPLTKFTTRLKPENVESVITDAINLAVNEVPGPVHVGVPAGIGQTEVMPENFSTQKIPTQIISDIQQTTFEVFSNSKKPVLAIGLTAVRFGLGELILKIAEKFQIPVLLTPMAKGLFPENHPLYAGVLFHALSNRVAQIYSNADLVIGVGYDPVEFNYEEWMPGVPLIHFDSKKADIDESVITEVHNETGNLQNLLLGFYNFNVAPKHWDVKKIEQNKNAIFKKFVPTENDFGPLAIVHWLRKILPPNGILTVDVGAHLHLIGQQWQTPEPQKLIMTNGWSAMGFAVPAAMAAKLCNPDLPVVCLVGDGGFLMTCGELATAKRLKLKIIFIVIVDGSLSLIRLKQEKKNLNNQYGTELNSVGNVPTNHFFGVPVFRVETRQEYLETLQMAVKLNEPVLIEAIVNGAEYNELILKPHK